MHHHCIIWLGPVLVPVLTPTVWCPLHLGFGDKRLEAERRLPVSRPGNSQMPCGLAPPHQTVLCCGLSLWPRLENTYTVVYGVCVFGDRVITQSWRTDERP